MDGKTPGHAAGTMDGKTPGPATRSAGVMKKVTRPSPSLGGGIALATRDAYAIGRRHESDEPTPRPRQPVVTEDNKRRK
jgi:hypothetical protein